tara:strand:- start:475 stop:723 length:249 start_codon:yes stop_codon:yes gene_type:complete
MLEDENELLEMSKNNIHLLVDGLYDDKNYKNLFYQFSKLFSHKLIDKDRLSLRTKWSLEKESSFVHKMNKSSMDFLFDLYDE